MGLFKEPMEVYSMGSWGRRFRELGCRDVVWHPDAHPIAGPKGEGSFVPGEPLSCSSC